MPGNEIEIIVTKEDFDRLQDKPFRPLLEGLERTVSAMRETFRLMAEREAARISNRITRIIVEERNAE